MLNAPPGETAGAWWGATGAAEAREQAAARLGYATEFDVGTYFLHDVPQDVLRTGPEQPREEDEDVFGEPCRLERWPDVTIMFLREETTAFSRSNFNLQWSRTNGIGLAVENTHLVADTAKVHQAAIAQLGALGKRPSVYRHDRLCPRRIFIGHPLIGTHQSLPFYSPPLTTVLTIGGGSKITLTSLLPHLGHMSRLPSLPKGKFRPLAHTSVGMSKTA